MKMDLSEWSKLKTYSGNTLLKIYHIIYSVMKVKHKQTNNLQEAHSQALIDLHPKTVLMSSLPTVAESLWFP